VKRVGEVVGVAQSVAVVRSPNEEFPEVGTGVVNEDLDDCGRVVDVFGPVERPYLAVSPGDDVHLPALVGRPLYAR